MARTPRQTRAQRERNGAKPTLPTTWDTTTRQPNTRSGYTLVQDSAFLQRRAKLPDGRQVGPGLDRYRAFLRTSSAGAPNRDTAEKLVAEIKRKLDEEKKNGPSRRPKPRQPRRRRPRQR